MTKLSVFSGWFVPFGKRERLSFFLSNIVLFFLGLIVYIIFGIYYFSQFLLILSKKISFSNSLIFVFLVGLFLFYIGTVFIIQRLRDIGIKNNKVFLIIFLSLLVTYIIEIFTNNDIFSFIVAFIYTIFFLFLLFCPSNYLNRN